MEIADFHLSHHPYLVCILVAWALIHLVYMFFGIAIPTTLYIFLKVFLLVGVIF